MLTEFAANPKEKFTIDIVSQVSAAKRKKRIEAEGSALGQLQIKQLEFDYTVPAYLDDIDLHSYDNVVLLTSERLKSGAESDARTILGYLTLRDLMASDNSTPPVLVELADPDNVPLFENRRGEIIVSPLVVSHMLAQVTLRRELRAVFDELFGAADAEIHFYRIADYGVEEIVSRMPNRDMNPAGYTFSDLKLVADARGEIAIGIRQRGQESAPHGGVSLNPGSDKQNAFNDDDEIIVLTT